MQSELIKHLQSESVLPIFVYELNQLRERQVSGGFVDEPCPIYRHKLTDNNSFILPEERTHIRRHVMPAENYHRYNFHSKSNFFTLVRVYKFSDYFFTRSIFVWLWEEPVSKVLQILDDSIMWCLQKKEAGIYHEFSKIYFYSKGSDGVLMNKFSFRLLLYFLKINFRSTSN